MRKGIIIIMLFTCWSLYGINLDSLFNIWQDQTQLDSIRANAYADYIWDGYLFSQPDTAFILAEKLVLFGIENRYLRAQYLGFTLQGVSWENRSDYRKTLDYYTQALDIAKQMGHPAALAVAYNNVGSIYHDRGYYTKALDNYIKSLEFNEPIKIGITLNNIGTIYRTQGDHSKALEYYNRSLELGQQNGDQGAVAVVLSAIGSTYRELGDYSNSIDYYYESLTIFEQIDHQFGIAETYTNIGQLYDKQGDYLKALNYYTKGLGFYEQVGDRDGIAASLNSIGDIYQSQGDYEKALEYCQKGYNISVSINSLLRKKSSCSCLYDTHKAMGNGIKALHYLEQLNAIKDSLDTKETTKKLEQMEFQKQLLADSMANEEAKVKAQMAYEADVRKKKRSRNLFLGGGLLVLLLAGGLYSRNRYIRKSRDEISKEKDRSENLLLNILPAEIAEELKQKGRADARDFDMVSILFTDFKEFTQTSEKLSAQELVGEINVCFEAFDAICGKFGIEKIKTIGDAYMAAGGLPVPDEAAAKDTVMAALEMQQFMVDRSKELEQQGKLGFQMRAGIHTGPVVAGIVGVKKFQYDLWGDTVNTASRMESSGEVGKVNISQDTYELIKNDPEFSFEPRGALEVKGKGEVEMYFVYRSSEGV